MSHVKRTRKELSDSYALRNTWYRSGPYWESMHRVKVKSDQYKCDECKGVYRLREVQVDHIVPCVDPVVGWVSLQEFARRLFCSSKELRVLCKDKCHKSKTNAENKVRREHAK